MRGAGGPGPPPSATLRGSPPAVRSAEKASGVACSDPLTLAQQGAWEDAESNPNVAHEARGTRGGPAAAQGRGGGRPSSLTGPRALADGDTVLKVERKRELEASWG